MISLMQMYTQYTYSEMCIAKPNSAEHFHKIPRISIHVISTSYLKYASAYCKNSPKLIGKSQP